MYFWPMTEGELTNEYDHLCIEKSYWELLDKVIGAHIPHDPTPVWHLLEDGQALADESWGYAEGCVYSPHHAQELLRVLTALSGIPLQRRFAFVMYGHNPQAHSTADSQSAETDDEDDLFLAIEFCFETTKQFITFAIENQQAVLCYVA